ncbi:mitochondrial ribosomal protein subunit S2 [Coprinopsis sp. MPI-PUGE-AT-0042]|nr:mitochondrial ribosomal protein subunit S2 [Coprinopsis sp. MPI-PUGE-AT-0042]
MSLPSVLVQASARCSARCLASRSLSTATAADAGRRLETPSDWDAFRERKGRTKLLIDMMSNYGSAQNKDNTFQLRDQLHKPARDATVSALLAAGAHFGHASSRMNPNFTPYAYGTRAGITIIDMDNTLPLLRRAANVTRAVARAGGQILFIGTRPDLKPVVQKAAERIGQEQGYYIGERWLPGTLTNRRQFFQSEELEAVSFLPDLAIVLNPVQNAIAIREFALTNVPTIGIIDSNVDPRLVMYPIPANDENTRAAELIGGVLSIAAKEGVALRAEDARNTVFTREKKFRQRTNRFT